MACNNALCLWLYSPLLDLGRLFSFLIFFTQSVDALDGGSACRKAAACTQGSTNTEEMHIDIHTSSGIRVRPCDITIRSLNFD
jgi:hypothetical protein